MARRGLIFASPINMRRPVARVRFSLQRGVVMMLRKVIAALAAAIVLLPISAFAQDSHWGVAFSITPKWTVPSSFNPIFGADTQELESTDFSIGIARGQAQSGDWSVSYFRKSFKDGTSVSSLSTDCSVFGSSGCFISG